MAGRATVTPIVMKRKNTIYAQTALVACGEVGTTTKTYEAEFAMTEKDFKYLIEIQNVNATTDETATIKAGDNPVLALGDKTITIPKGTTQVISIDSALFKNMSGALKSKVVIFGESANIKVRVTQLP